MKNKINYSYEALLNLNFNLIINLKQWLNKTNSLFLTNKNILITNTKYLNHD